MTIGRCKIGGWIGFAIGLLWALTAAAQGLPTTSPAKVGFSAERLRHVDAFLHQVVEDGDYVGVSFAAARHGRVFYQKTVGLRDVSAATPVTTDTIFRIYSMTKPVTAVAMMMLFEEGKWRLDDPVTQYIPSFANLMVQTDGTDGPSAPMKPARAMTMRDLMRHTAGLSYGYFSATSVDKLYQEQPPLQAPTLPAMIERLSSLPLLAHPGTAWHYSVAVDVQGYLVEQLSGQSLPDFFRDRIFTPLGMADTDFHVPETKQARFAELYVMDPDAKALKPVGGDQFGARNYAAPPTLPSGGGGLVSSLGDYLRFAQMLLNGGALDGVRLLSPQTVELMRADHLPDDLGSSPASGVGLAPGVGFGLGFAVINDPVKAGSLAGKGSYSWGGAAGTWFWIDPVFDIIAVGMVQRMGEKPNMSRATSPLLYQALIQPEK